MIDFAFILNNLLLGTGLAMDAFSVSLANGLNEPKMKRSVTIFIAGTFAFFQALMPMLGWLFVHTAAKTFSAVQRFIPYVAFAVLAYIGGKMLYDGIKRKDDDCAPELTLKILIVQGIATSMDALSVGFTIYEYNLEAALLAAFIIAFVTFFICFTGIIIGRKFGTALSNKASLSGGIIIIAIGLEILIKGIISG